MHKHSQSTGPYADFLGFYKRIYLVFLVFWDMVDTLLGHYWNMGNTSFRQDTV